MGAEIMAINRRGLLAAGAVAGVAIAFPKVLFARDTAPTASIVDLPVGKRATQLLVWAPARPRGVVLFSHGHGSWPDRYGQLASTLTADQWAVLAPMHVDSMHYADRASFSLQQTFPERLADMNAASVYAAQRFGTLPTIAVGHSFGTLTALCLAGALAGMGNFRNPAVRAVLGFSTPGRIPGLVRSDAFTSVASPVMIVTGTNDLVPDFVTDPTDHLFPAQTAPTPSFSLIVKDADHGLVASDAFAHAEPAARLFVHGYGLGDRASRSRLATWRPLAGDRFAARNIA